MRFVPIIVCSIVLALTLAGCTNFGGSPSQGEVDLVWGQRGVADGRFQKPRSIAIDKHDRLYIVDLTARIQVFDADGKFLRSWRTPAWQNGKPTGLSIDRGGNVLVADTHYFRLLTYTPEGKLLDEKTIGGTTGSGPGEFGFVTDAARDSQGNLYISEYGEFDRIQKFSPEGKFLMMWGGHGTEPGEFMRPNKIAIDEHDHLWVADSCNHRIQVFDATGSQAKLIKIWGEEGEAPGQMRYPYDIVLDRAGNVLVSEFGNHRVQRFTRDGKSLAVFGSPGRGPGQFYQPWGLVEDSQGRLHVLDSYNHRVQRLRM